MTLSYDTTYDMYGKPMLTAAQYADAVGTSVRTVKRWLAADELPGAVQDARGHWMIPADADRTPTSAGVVQMIRDTSTRTAADDLELARMPVVELVDRMPGFVPVDQAAQLLGIPETAIRRERLYFQLRPFGAHGALVMPRHRIKEILG